MSVSSSSSLPRRLLKWYDAHARRLPWRATSGKTPDPYTVWLSEVMLQQTRVATVEPYYHAFLKRWPSLESLAGASLEEVLAAWAGLGYYSRARKLHQCARHLQENHGGKFPQTYDGLLELPGIGPYSAAAIAAIAFGKRESVVDGNVLRVMARLHGVQTPLPKAKKELSTLAGEMVPKRRAGDYAQALMDLGAMVCTPRSPDCPICPWKKSCAAHAAGEAHLLPRRAAKPERPLRYGAAFWAMRKDGSVLLERRPENGLLGAMMQVPGTEWRLGEQAREEDWLTEAPFRVQWSRLEGEVSHGFTHFRLRLVVYAAKVSSSKAKQGRWVAADDLAAEALPSLMRKVARHVAQHWSGMDGVHRTASSL